MSAEIVIFLLYLISLIIIGSFSLKFTKGIEDFFVASRGLGRWILAFTHEASDMSGFLIMALPGFAYMFGMAGAWMVWVGTTGVILVFALNGITLRRLGEKYGAITLSDVLEIRYYDKTKHTLRFVSVVIIGICSFLYISSQCIAAAKLLEVAFGFRYSVGVLISGIVTVLYTEMGGMRAVAWNNFFQGMIMIFGISFACILTVLAVGGIGNIFNRLNDINPSLTTPFPNWGMVLMGIGFVLGGGSISYLGQPHFQMQYLSARSKRDLADALVISLVLISLFGLFAFVAGAAGRVLYPEISMLPGADNEKILLHLFRTRFHGILNGLFLAAGLAAIMSSAVAWLLVASSGVARDIYQKIIRPDASDKTLLRVSRYATAGIGVLGIIVALRPQSVLWAVQLAWGGCAQFGPVLVLGMYWKRGTRKAALISLVVGFLVNIGWFLAGWYSIVHQAVPGMIIGTLLMVIISLLDKAPPPEISYLVEHVRTGRNVAAESLGA